MARGGTITPRPLQDGSQAYVLYWRVDGRRCKKTVRGSRRDAEAELTKVLAARDRGEQRKPAAGTFATYAAAWLEAKEPRLENATYREYDAHLRLRLVPAFGQRKLRDMTRTRIDAYVAAEHAAGKVGAKTINNSLVVLAQIMARAVRDGHIATNPASSTRDDPLHLPYETPTMQHLTREQARAYLVATPTPYAALAATLVTTGLRIGEAVALRWADVDLDARTLRVSRSRKLDGSVGGTKSDKARVVHLAPSVADTLAAHRRTRLPEMIAQPGRPEDALVWATKSGKMLDPGNVRRWHARTLKAAGLPPTIRLHDLRHTAATLAVTAGESVLYVQAQLGHANVRTTMRYAHADHQAHAAAAARVADYLAAEA